jgi:hypothetical protein
MYTEEEICTIYRSAHKDQDRIQLLQDLTLYSKDKLIKILIKHGYEVDKYRKNAIKKKIRTEKLIHFHSLGMSDVEIGRYLGVVASSVKYWRDKLGLETNYHNYKNKNKPAGTGN